VFDTLSPMTPCVLVSVRSQRLSIIIAQSANAAVFAVSESIGGVASTASVSASTAAASLTVQSSISGAAAMQRLADMHRHFQAIVSEKDGQISELEVRRRCALPATCTISRHL
jgi:hypothetical protein